MIRLETRRYHPTATRGECGSFLLAALWLAATATAADSLVETGTHRLAEFSTQSCLTAACHGSLEADQSAKNIRRDEYQVWLTDPHAKAYRTLIEPRSMAILRNLGVLDKKSRIRQDSAEWRNCLACHETSAPPGMKHTDQIVGEGVSCQSCHGSPTNWLEPHSRKEWLDEKKWPDIEKKNAGLISGRDVAERAEACVRCHVGDERREVNHDMIAAGHPALRFELTWYESRMPRHWNPGRPAASKHSPQQRWLIGQLTMLELQLKQLERKTKAEGPRTLSGHYDLATYDCFACHHDLRETSWRQQRGFVGLKAGQKVAVPWGNWNMKLIEPLADPKVTTGAGAFVEKFKDLTDLMNWTASANPEQIHSKAQTAREQVERWKAAVLKAPAGTAAIDWSGVSDSVESWDALACLVLGLVSGLRDHEAPADAAIQAMQALRFPVEKPLIDSPRDFPKPGSYEAMKKEWQTRLKILSKEAERESTQNR